LSPAFPIDGGKKESDKPLNSHFINSKKLPKKAIIEED